MLSVSSFSDSSIESSSDDEQDVSTMISAGPPQISNVASSSSPTSHRPHRKLSRGEEINKFQHEFEMVKENKFACSLGLLLQIFEAWCQTPGCVNAPTISYRFVCGSLIIDSSCSFNHKHRFCSSHELGEGVYVNSLQAVASILLSGKNFCKN